MSKRLIMVVLVGFGVCLLTAAANADLITVVTYQALTGAESFDLTTMGNVDWEVTSAVTSPYPGVVTNPERKNVTPVLGPVVMTWSPWSNPIGPGSGGPTFTYTDGVGSVPSPTTIFCRGVNQGQAYTVTAPADTDERMITVWAGKVQTSAAGKFLYLEADLTDGTRLWQQVMLPTTPVWYEFQLTYTADYAQTLFVRWGCPGGDMWQEAPPPLNGHPSSTGVEGVSISSVALYKTPPTVYPPEPGTMTLLGFGALGLFGYIRRQRMK